MCILFVHVHPEPKKGDYRLIVASNRDEYYDRPAATAKMFETNVIAGKVYLIILKMELFGEFATK